MISAKHCALGLASVAFCASAAAAPLPLPPGCDLTSLQVAAGYVTGANTIKFFAAVGAAIFACVLLNAMRDAFKKIPMAVWKSLAYGVSIALCAGSLWLSPEHAPIAQFIGSVFAAMCLGVILYDLAAVLGVKSKNSASWHASVAVMGLGLAYLQANPMVAAVGVAGALALLGFSLIPSPTLSTAGFNSDSSLARATGGALGLLIPAAIVRASSGSLGAFEIYWPAIAWVCSLTAALGLLIMSSRFYDKSGGAVYVARNLVALAFGLFCVWAGSIHGMTEIQRVGGTLMILWLFLKPWEIPNAGALSRSIIGLASCGGLYVLAQDVIANPSRWSSILLF